MQSLASGAVTELCRQRLFTTQLVLYLSTMALSLPFGIEVLVAIMNAVRLAMFPLVFFPVGGITSLRLMSNGRCMVAIGLGIALLLGRHGGEKAPGGE